MKPASDRGELSLELGALDEPASLELPRLARARVSLFGRRDARSGEVGFDRAVRHVVGSKTGKVPAAHRTADHRGPTFGPRGPC